VAIDGPGGAGKSLFADRLAGYLGDAPIVHTDDFASWDEPIDWWHRLEADVLGPMERGQPVRYQAYDWVRRQLGEWRELRASEVVLLEGVSSSRRAVADRLALREASLATGRPCGHSGTAGWRKRMRTTPGTGQRNERT